MKVSLQPVHARDGRECPVFKIEPPEPDELEGLRFFIGHKRDASYHDICCRLEGAYAECCDDRYFFAELDGRLVAHAYYGFGRNTAATGNFGHVYTDPACRGMGLAGELVQRLVEDFRQSEAVFIVGACGRPWIVDIYRKYGFSFVRGNAGRGYVHLLKSKAAASLDQYRAQAFSPRGQANVCQAGMDDCYSADKLLSAFEPCESFQGVLGCRPTTLRDALLAHARHGGGCCVLRQQNGHCLGWAALVRESSDTPFNLVWHIHQGVADAMRLNLLGAVHDLIGEASPESCCFVDAGTVPPGFSFASLGYREDAALQNFAGRTLHIMRRVRPRKQAGDRGVKPLATPHG